MSPTELLGFLTKNGELKSFVPTKPLLSPWSKPRHIQALVRKMKNIEAYSHSTPSALAGSALGLGSVVVIRFRHI